MGNKIRLTDYCIEQGLVFTGPCFDSVVQTIAGPLPSCKGRCGLEESPNFAGQDAG